MSTRTYEVMKQNRLAKMRAGQAGGEIVQLISDESIRMVLVPLTDGEWMKSLGWADQVAAGDNPAGDVVRAETQKKAIILYAAREMSNWEQPFFESLEEVSELEHQDLNHLYDVYLEMVATASPSFYMLTEEMIDELKKVLARIEWRELSGRQQYAAMRLLNSILADSQVVNSSGSLSTSSLTRTNDSEIPATNANDELVEEVRESSSV